MSEIKGTTTKQLMNLRTFLIGLFVVCGIGTATAQPGPPAGYEIDPEYTQKSPDGAITIEQYVNKETDGKYQFWVRRKDTFTLLDEPPDYPARFRFTNDLKWIVRMQKTGSASCRSICTASLRKATYARPRSRSAILRGPT